eukprot:4245494-Pleurochrysis_carterae.AAC.1
MGGGVCAGSREVRTGGRAAVHPGVVLCVRSGLPFRVRTSALASACAFAAASGSRVSVDFRPARLQVRGYPLRSASRRRPAGSDADADAAAAAQRVLGADTRSRRARGGG